jgi:hypothetical protein
MENTNQLNITGNLPEQLGILAVEILGKALGKEIDQLNELSDTTSEYLSNYIDNISKSSKQNSITGLLFGSYDVSINIKQNVESYSKEQNGQAFIESLHQFNDEAAKILGIRLIEEDTDGEQPPRSTGEFILFHILNLLNRLTRKKPANEQVREYYLYNLLVYETLMKNLDKLENLEKNRIKVLSIFWDQCKIIEQNILTLSNNDFDTEIARQKYSLNSDFETPKLLIGECRSAISDFVTSLKQSISDTHESFIRNKRTHEATISKESKKLDKDHLLDLNRKVEKYYQNYRGKWQNTVMALTDDWCLDLEIYALKYNILKGYFSFKNYLETRFRNPIDDRIDEMQTKIEELIKLVEPRENSPEEQVIGNLQQAKIEFRRKLVLRLLPAVKEMLINSEIPNEIDEFEKNTSKRFQALSKSKLIVKNPDYDRPIERSEMNKISPLDLVSFEMQPRFMVVFPSLKNAFIRHIQEMQVRFDEIPEIVDFSIESAIGYYNDKKNINEALKVGHDGIKRALNKLDDLQSLRTDFYLKEIDFLKEKIDKLINEISEITDNESAVQIKLRVTKAKAIEQSKAVRDRMINNIKNFLPHILQRIRSVYDFLVESSIKIRKQLEGEQKKGFITSDVSDYLAETEEAINRLPFVYQRLFKIEPLKTHDLYIDRTQATEKLKLAYEKWKSGKFAPAIIIGEKGSGKTSLVNRFLSSKNIAEEFVYLDLHKEISVEKAYEKIINSMGNPEEKPKENEGEHPRKILVIDGLEKLFETKINGFETLLNMMHLISKTNHRYFWIVNCHLYSYKYLVKSINISDYFGYHIELEDLTADELRIIIEKRHNISGFRLKYLPDTTKKAVIPLKKVEEESEQQELKNTYFDRLQKIVKGNITQAFLYWTRSAAEVTEDIIYLNLPGDKSLDIVKSISMSKFEILKNIVIHNGITPEKHAEIFRIPAEQSRLHLSQLHDDGIIVDRSGFYYLNPMIYKQIVEQMYNLNLLH